ncbi:MAG: PrsW family intramembrane metalloprotease [Ignavibacteriaceae bacterium]|nr:PrsW family intramembrane metalloprotease [Ignavibacteriaceae bacterium]
MSVVFSFLAAVFPMLVYLYLIWRFDRYEREPTTLVLVNFLWGAVGAIILTTFLSSLIQLLLLNFILQLSISDFWDSVLFAPVIEELTKGFFLFIMVKNKKFDNITDGIVYGGAIGLGFGMTENFFYFITNSSSIYNWFLIVIIRTLFSAVMHCVTTGILGMILGYSKFKNGFKRTVLVIIGFFIAIVIHSLWNLFVSIDSLALIGFVYMLLVVGILIFIFNLSVYKEKQIIFSQLSEESKNGLIPAQHLGIITSNERHVPGWVDERIRKIYILSAVRLAFRKEQTIHSTGLDKKYHQTDIENLRESISNLLEKK